MPAAQIRPTRLEVNDRFPMLGFAIRTTSPGARAEVAIATDWRLLGRDGKDQRNAGNFFSSRGTANLNIPRGEAVWVVPPEVLASFVGAEKLYFGLATASNGGGFSVDVMPTEASP
jgi:hypothetical protein